MVPTEEQLQTLMLETTFNACKLLNNLLSKQTMSSEEKNAADTALKFLELTSRSGSNF
jgi:hypothetical protein